MPEQFDAIFADWLGRMRVALAGLLEPNQGLGGIVEGAGALLLWARFSRDFPWGEALYKAVFHSISAFNNAGFSLFSDSLVAYQGDLTKMGVQSFTKRVGMDYAVGDCRVTATAKTTTGVACGGGGAKHSTTPAVTGTANGSGYWENW